MLYDLGYVSSAEPYARLFNQGYILAAAYTDERGMYVEAARVVAEADGTFTFDGRPVDREWGAMGKSLKNFITPDELCEMYGADTFRLHLMSTGPLDASRPWEPRDVVGMYRFLQRLWRNLIDEETGELVVTDAPADDDTRRLLHRTIDFVRTEIEAPPLQHRDRQADRAQQPSHQVRRHPAGGRRAAGADALPVRPAHRRGAVAPARP